MSSSNPIADREKMLRIRWLRAGQNMRHSLTKDATASVPGHGACYGLGRAIPVSTAGSVCAGGERTPAENTMMRRPNFAQQWPFNAQQLRT
jgi:hypothetical protein